MAEVGVRPQAETTAGESMQYIGWDVGLWFQPCTKPFLPDAGPHGAITEGPHTLLASAKVHAAQFTSQTDAQKSGGRNCGHS